MSVRQLTDADRLSNLPYEVLREIFLHLCPIGGGGALVITCKRLYGEFIVHLYEEAGRRFDWLPLLFGISTGNINTLERCLDAGAPLNHQWTSIGHHLEPMHPEIRCLRLRQPLHWAMWYDQKEAQKWLISKGAVYTPEKPCWKVRMNEADSLVFDVRTSEGNWRPVMCRPEIQPPGEIYQRSAHLVWYGSEVEPALILPRLRQTVRYYRGYLHSSLALWITRFWIDLLLSSSDYAPILGSGFTGGYYLEDGEFYPLPEYDDKIEIASFIRPMLSNLSDDEFAGHFSVSIFYILLDSSADASFIASTYAAVFGHLAIHRYSGEGLLVVLQLYPLILGALIDSGADNAKVEEFRRLIMGPLSATGEMIVVDTVLRGMADSGADPARMKFAFWPLVQKLRSSDPYARSFLNFLSQPFIELFSLGADDLS